MGAGMDADTAAALDALDEHLALATGDAAKLRAQLEDRPPAPTVVLAVDDVSATAIVVEWTFTGAEPAGWTIGRDGMDSRGSGPWQTTLPGAARSQRFGLLLPGTDYQITLTPAGGQPVSITVTTGDPGVPSGLHGPRALADGWVPLLVERDDFPSINTARWSLYNSVGHGGKGLRRPSAWSIVDDPAAADGRALRCVGTPEGVTGGMAHRRSQRYGRWSIRSRAHGDPRYHHVGLTWPSAENWPVGGEIDFAEGNASADRMHFFLHYARTNNQTHGQVDVDTDAYHWWEMEWSPDAVRGWCDGKLYFEDRDRAHFAYPEFGAHHLCLQLDWFPEEASRTGGAEMYVDTAVVYGHPATTTPRAALATPAATSWPRTSPTVDRHAKV